MANKIKDGFSGQRMIVLPQAVVQLLEQHEWARELYPTEIGYFPKAANHYRDRPEGASEYIFIYCVDGQGWVEVNGERQEVPANCFFIIPQDTSCRYGVNEENPWTIYWMHIKGVKATLLATALGMGKVNSINIEEDSRVSDRIALFEEIYSTLDHNYSEDNLHYAQTVLYHFLGSLLFIKQFRQAVPSDKTNQSVVDLAIHYMRENLEKNLSLADVAEFVGYSVSQLTALFKQQTGVSPNNYLLQLKVREACKYLRLTEMKINQLCYKVGFDDPLYFTRIFTKIIGCSPTEYRKRDF